MLEFILLGIAQGIFEWLPISSEGIVALMSSFLVNGINAVDVALFLHLGTLLAVLVYFRKDWKEVILLRDKRMLRFLVIATIVSLAVGYPAYKMVRNISVGASLLAVVGTGLLVTSYFHKTRKRFAVSMDKTSVIAGLLQGLAVIPGLSRSGSTIFGLSLGDIKTKEILKFSYMMSVPVVLASSALIMMTNPVVAAGWPAVVSSFVVGIATLHFLMKFSEKINFAMFTLVFGILCYIGALISWLA
ncbi:undecaprenyl-diphosphate phosphatase [Candidatus Woesearchaeota archaeon]|nr:undecaprenyl-diphosphate phosphatase [Candidatus Woesearchaeota archaeon]